MKILSRRHAARIIFCAPLALIGLTAQADVREIPSDTLRVRLSPYTNRSLIVNGRETLLAPGARIVSESNRTIVAGRVPSEAIARIAVNAEGRITAVWLLTPEEINNSAPTRRVSPIRY